MGGFPFYAGQGDFSKGGSEGDLLFTQQSTGSLRFDAKRAVTPRARLTLSAGADFSNRSQRAQSLGVDSIVNVPSAGASDTAKLPPLQTWTGRATRNAVLGEAALSFTNGATVAATLRDEWSSMFAGHSRRTCIRRCAARSTSRAHSRPRTTGQHLQRGRPRRVVAVIRRPHGVRCRHDVRRSGANRQRRPVRRRSAAGRFESRARSDELLGIRHGRHLPSGPRHGWRDVLSPADIGVDRSSSERARRADRAQRRCDVEQRHRGARGIFARRRDARPSVGRVGNRRGKHEQRRPTLRQRIHARPRPAVRRAYRGRTSRPTVGDLLGRKMLRDPSTGALLLRGGLPLPDSVAGNQFLGSSQPKWSFGAQSSIRYRWLTIAGSADGGSGDRSSARRTIGAACRERSAPPRHDPTPACCSRESMRPRIRQRATRVDGSLLPCPRRDPRAVGVQREFHQAARASIER